MTNRWAILSVLFLVRTMMAFQFQSVAALAPFIADSYGANLADIGLLIGLYLAPGVIIAIPGGAIAQRFGDRRVVIASVILMMLGGALMGFGPGWGSLVAGRVLAGIGGIATSVTMTKMATDWFAGREIATAMGIFINSWPIGIGLSLLALPWLATLGGLQLAWIATLFLFTISLLLFMLVYRPAATSTARTSIAASGQFPVVALCLAGAIWALYNSALAVVFSFAPALLIQWGWSLEASSSLTSLFVFALALTVPIAGYIADRTGRRDTVLVTGIIAFAVMLIVTLFTPASAIWGTIIVMGLISGIAAAPIVALPASILHPDSRALGTGVFYAIYYGVMMAVPTIAGWIADSTGDVGMAFLLGALMLALCVPTLGLFRRMTRDVPAMA